MNSPTLVHEEINMNLESIKNEALGDLKEIDIEGDKYTIKLVSGEMGLNIQERLFGTFLPSLGVAFDNFKSGFDRMFVEDSPGADLAVAIAANLPQLQMTGVIKELLNGCYCNGQEVDLDHFRGKYGRMYILAGFALKENFGDVFPQVLKVLGLEDSVIPTLRTMIDQMKEGNVENLNEFEEK